MTDNDLVTRLRDPGFWTSDGKVMFEAADEIVRLRNDNRILTKQVMEAAVRKGTND